MRGYKAFKEGYVCRGFKYEIGKTYEIEGKLKICENGFHFCRKLIDVFGYYSFDRENIVLAEVEAIGDIVQEGTKYCTDKIKIVRAVDWSEVDAKICDGFHNIGDYNSGNWNTGSMNSGSHNSCDHNSGNWNTGGYNGGSCNSGGHNSGNWNTGDFNDGSCNSGGHNSGSCNSGYYNSGSHNTGYYNSGSHNTGNWNSGSHNTGDYNTGNWNSGDWNSGNHNIGDYNSGSYNAGFFNTDEPTVRLFNTDSGMTFKDLCALNIYWNDLEVSKDTIKSLPNYDAQIFYEATGIDWREDE